MTDQLIVTGARGESFADVARRIGIVGGEAIPPDATDTEVLEIFKQTTVPSVIDLGLIDVSTPFLELTAELDDGLAPGDVRERFHSFNVNLVLTNVSSNYHTFFKGSTNGQPVYEVIAPTRYDGSGGYVSGGIWGGVFFRNPNSATDMGGIAFAPNSAIVLGHRIDPNTGQIAAVFKAGWDTSATGSEAGSVAVWQSDATDRTHIISQKAFVIEAERHEREVRPATGASAQGYVPYTGYIGASANGATIFYNNSGQTPTVATPLGAGSVSATYPAFEWGSLNAGTGVWTRTGKLWRDGSVFMANASTPSTPTGGGTLFVSGGALKFIGSSGTVTTIAPA